MQTRMAVLDARLAQGIQRAVDRCRETADGTDHIEPVGIGSVHGKSPLGTDQSVGRRQPKEPTDLGQYPFGKAFQGPFLKQVGAGMYDLFQPPARIGDGADLLDRTAGPPSEK